MSKTEKSLRRTALLLFPGHSLWESVLDEIADAGFSNLGTGLAAEIDMAQLRAVRFADAFHQTSFEVLLAHHDFLSSQIDHLAQQLKALAESEIYQELVEILTSIPGLGWLSAMEILLELQDVARFQRAEQMAAYVGLTPGQHSSEEHVRLGQITRQGKSIVRTLLVLASWRLIDQEGAMREKYERIKARAGGKRAIIAIARTLFVRLRRLLLNREPFALGLVGG